MGAGPGLAKIAQLGVIRCLEVPGNASGIVRDVGKYLPVTRCRSGWIGMVATGSGHRPGTVQLDKSIVESAVAQRWFDLTVVGTHVT